MLTSGTIKEGSEGKGNACHVPLTDEDGNDGWRTNHISCLDEARVAVGNHDVILHLLARDGPRLSIRKR